MHPPDVTVRRPRGAATLPSIAPADDGVIESELLGFTGVDITIATVVESLQQAIQASVLEIFGLCLAAAAACVAVSLLIRAPALHRTSPGAGAQDPTQR